MNQKMSSCWGRLCYKFPLLNGRRSEGETQYVSLDKDTIKITQTNGYVVLQQKGKHMFSWDTVYTMPKIAPYYVISGYVESINQEVIVLSVWTGNGGFLTYSIFGKHNGKIVKLAGNSDIYKGDIFFEDGKLLEKRDSRYSEWIHKNQKLVLVPYIIPKIPGALRIEYEITSNGRVKLAKKHYKVKVGTIVQLIRTDLNSNLEQGSISAVNPNEPDPLFEYLDEYKEAFRMVKQGKVEVKIAPDLDWSKAISIQIQAN